MGAVGATETKAEQFDRFVDISVVVLLSLATVLTAWCGYQSARWSTLATRSYNAASASRLIGAEHQDRANALTIVDINLFLQYIIALKEGHPGVRDFIYARMRPEMRPAMNAWLATHPLTNPRAPSSPFAMPQYRLAEDAAAAKFSAAATDTFQTAQHANEAADAFVRLTVIFAGVSFLAGICTKLKYPWHTVIVSAGYLTIAYGFILLIQQPVL